jgi:hypothetical protein
MVSAIAGNRSATVVWMAPGSDGGSAITSWTVTPFIGINAQPAVTVIAPGTVTSTTVTGLTNGISYTFTVSAANVVGTGPASPASNAVTPSGPPLGDPNNTRDSAVPVTPMGCGLQPTSSGTSGTTGNDGSNAWYVVNFAGPATLLNASCTLQITISGSSGVVLDVYRGSSLTPFASASQVTPPPAATENSPAAGASELLYIHVYDTIPPPSPGGSYVSGSFNLGLNVF